MMKAKEIRIGNKYIAKVSNKMTTVQVIDIRTTWNDRTVYDVVNLTTRRRTTFRSPSKFRLEVSH